MRYKELLPPSLSPGPRPRPPCLSPHNTRFVTPAADLTGLTPGYSDTSCRRLIGQRITAEALIGH